MDSFFLAEMFKYLFLLFAEEDDLPFDVEDYVFTTEAHLLPLSLSTALRSHTPSPDNSTVLPVSSTKQEQEQEHLRPSITNFGLKLVQNKLTVKILHHTFNHLYPDHVWSCENYTIKSFKLNYTKSILMSSFFIEAQRYAFAYVLFFSRPNSTLCILMLIFLSMYLLLGN